MILIDAEFIKYFYFKKYYYTLILSNIFLFLEFINYFITDK
jgi:hypothetical protein